MKSLFSLGLCFADNTLSVLNQQLLPLKEEWLICHTPSEMIEMIKMLKVRGAPLIGISAALALAQFVEKGANKKAIYDTAMQLISARPTAVNLSYCINQQLSAYTASNNPKTIIDVAEYLFEEDARLSDSIANFGANIISDNESILTHCNTGGLVTTGTGTALGAIIRAHNQGKRVHVYVDETRPLLQGARLTAWECVKNNIPHTLICDNMAASLMRQGKIHRVIVGADRIAANGDTANKIGTYSVAALAHLHKIPFHVAAPKSTFDWQCPDGDSIVIEERDGAEVKGITGMSQVCWAPSESNTYNPAFDVTPHRFMTSFITDKGVFEKISDDINSASKLLFLQSIKFDATLIES